MRLIRLTISYVTLTGNGITNICSYISKTEMLHCKAEIRNFLNICLNFKSELIIKGAIAQIEKKQSRLTCESIPLEKPILKK